MQQELGTQNWKKKAHFSWGSLLGFASYFGGWERRVRLARGGVGVLCDLGQVISSLCKLEVTDYGKMKMMIVCKPQKTSAWSRVLLLRC